MQEQVVPFAAPRVRAAGRPVRGHRPGSATFSSGVMDPPHRDRQPYLSPTLGPHDEDTACLAPSRDVMASMFGGEKRNPIAKRPRGASGVDTGDVARLGQGAGPTRTTQGRRVGRLEPKLHSLGVAGEFGHLPESAKNKRRGRRACPTAPLGAHGAMASARRARRRRRRLAWCARMGGITKSL